MSTFSSAPAGNATEEQWDAQETTLYDLYIIQNLTMELVVQNMKVLHNFHGRLVHRFPNRLWLLTHITAKPNTNAILENGGLKRISQSLNGLKLPKTVVARSLMVGMWRSFTVVSHSPKSGLKEVSRDTAASQIAGLRGRSSEVCLLFTKVDPFLCSSIIRHHCLCWTSAAASGTVELHFSSGARD
jgi:Clr5 domain